MVAILLRLGAGAARGARVAPKALPKPPAPVAKAPPPIPGVTAPPKPVEAKPPTAPAPLPLPPPVPQPKPGNTPPIVHIGKEDEKKDDCEKENKKYPVHPYSQRRTKAITPNQSHHVLQNAHFWEQGAAVPSVCKGYTKEAAPCIPLKGPSKDRTTPHGIVTAMQIDDATAARKVDKPTTYGDATANSERQLKAAGLSDKEIACIMAQVHASFQVICPGINSTSVLRKPQ